MATLSNSESRRLYSWWWDSHISPKNSKWLQENLKDMDGIVKAMIKLIEEDADSFARRAEMYYKKRPELMKLVEEFYRAYRALAERYDHAALEIGQAHQTIAEAFSNQMPYEFSIDSPSSISGTDTEPRTPEMLHPIRALLDSEDLHKGALGVSSTCIRAVKSGDYESEITKKGLKQLHEMFGSGEVDSKGAQSRTRKGPNAQETEERGQSLQSGLSRLLGENQNLKAQIISDSVCAAKAEAEIQNLKDILARIQAEKEAVFNQYQNYSEKFSHLESELNQAQKDAGDLDERAERAEIEIQVLKEVLAVLESEREAGLIQYEQCRERISSLESMMSIAQEEARGLIARATTAETDAQNLKEGLSRVEAEKDAGILQYKYCLETIYVMESKILLSEENSRMLNEKFEKAHTEVRELKQDLAKLRKEKDATAVLYLQCLETIEKMETKISHTQGNVQRLNNEIRIGVKKLKNSEEHRDLLEKSNQSLLSEAHHLTQKIALKDEELSETQADLERLQCSFQDEHLRFMELETKLQALRAFHSQSQEEQRSLTSELINGLQMLKDLELHKHGLEKEIQHVKEENQSLNELNLSSNSSIQNLENEIFTLKGMKKKLEEEFALQAEQTNSLLNDIYNLKVEINGLNERYQALILQVESVGLNPNNLESSVKNLQNESLKLKEICERERDERESLYEKLKSMDKVLENHSVLQSSWSELNIMLGGSKEKVKELQESSQFLQEEKSSLISEKAILLSQLQIMTANMQKLLEKNSLLENSLAGVNVELEGLRAKSNSLQEYCEQLDTEKLSLLNERSTMVSQLEFYQQRHEVLEKRFVTLEEKYAGLEKEKQTTLSQVEELRGSLDIEKRELASYMLSSEAQLEGLENSICNLKEGNKLGRKEFEDELDKALNYQVEIFILKNFMKELEEKNYSLLIECQGQAEASRLSEKLISELEGKNFKQQVEAELMLDEIENLRKVIHLVFTTLQIDSDEKHEGSILHEQITLSRLLENIDGLKCSLLTKEDEKQHLLVENLVLFTLLEEMSLNGLELGSEKNKELNVITNKCMMLQDENKELQEKTKEVDEIRDLNDQLNHQITISKDLLAKQAKEVSETNMEFEASKNLNAELCASIQELKKDCEESKLYKEQVNKQMLEISDKCVDQSKVIQQIRRENDNLTTDISILCKESEEHRSREANLNSELQERSNEFELWEAEAATFYFDLQMSTTREVLLENEVHELTEICQRLKNGSDAKSFQIEQMKEKTDFLESEIGGLRAQLSAYVPVVASLNDNIASLEYKTILRTQYGVGDIQEQQDEELENLLHDVSCGVLREDASSIVPDGLSNLRKMQNRIRAVEKVVSEEMGNLAVQGSTNTTDAQEPVVKENVELKLRDTTYQEKNLHMKEAEEMITNNLRSLTTKTEVKSGILIKDIPLDQVSDYPFYGTSRRRSSSDGLNDQMLELWETYELDHRIVPIIKRTEKLPARGLEDNNAFNRIMDVIHGHSGQSLELNFEREVGVDRLEVPTSMWPQKKAGKKTHFLERLLASDSQKLTCLKTTVSELKMEMNNKRRKGKDVKYETVKRQLQKIDEALLELVHVNDQLMKSSKEFPSYLDQSSVDLNDTRNDEIKRVAEQARKWSEKIGWLQFEVQNIQYVLLKLEDEKKITGKYKIHASKASVILRDFISNGRRSSWRRKNNCLCGCMRPSTNED